MHISGRIVLGKRVEYSIPPLFVATAEFSVSNSHITSVLIPLSDWLKKRLTPAKKKEPRWAEFSEASQSFWEESFDPESAKIDNLRSVFTAAQDDLVTVMEELGDRFRDDIGLEEDRPLHIVWRRLEIQGKETESLIQMALKRKFFGIDIQWVPLYAHKTEAYGTDLRPLDEILQTGLNIDDYFLTSRGRIRIASSTIDERAGVSFLGLLSAVDEEIERLLPTHIVYDGPEVSTNDLSLTVFFCGFIHEGIIEHIDAGDYIPPIEDTTGYLVTEDGQPLVTEDGSPLIVF